MSGRVRTAPLPDETVVWLTFAEACTHARVSRSSLERAKADGAVQYRQREAGSKVWFRRDWLDAWIDGGDALADELAVRRARGS